MNDPLQKRPVPALFAALFFVAAAYVVNHWLN
jgi:hypothetical protein